MKFVSRFLLVLLLGGAAALQAQAPSRFAAYEHCKFADNLALAENTPLPSGVEGRTVKTIMGPKQVPLAGGTRLMYAYPQTDFFANVKVEQIPADGYAQAKQDLVANFEQILTGDDSSSRNYSLKPRLNGLEIYGLDRKKLEGGVLGIYLFFVDRTHTATTIYFLNQDPGARRFDNLEDYAKLRDTFLGTFTSCAAGLPRGRTAVARESPITPVAPAAPVAAPAAALPDAPTVQSSAAYPAVSSSSSADVSTAPGEAAATTAVPTAAAHPAAKAGARKTVAGPGRKASKPSTRGTKASKAKTTKKTSKKARTKRHER